METIFDFFPSVSVKKDYFSNIINYTLIKVKKNKNENAKLQRLSPFLKIMFHKFDLAGILAGFSDWCIILTQEFFGFCEMILDSEVVFRRWSTEKLLRKFLHSSKKSTFNGVLSWGRNRSQLQVLSCEFYKYFETTLDRPGLDDYFGGL